VNRDPGGWRPTVVILVAVVAGAALTGLLALVGDGREGDSPEGDGVAAAAVLEDPGRFVGTTVRVTGRVSDVLAARSVTLGPGRLLVVNIAAAPAIDDVADGNRSLVGEAVQVTGEVRIFRMDEIEAEVGALDEERFRVFSGLPVVIARSIDPAPAAAASYPSLLESG